MKFIKLYLVLFISQLSFHSYAQVENDSIIISKELINITFTNKNTITDLGNIKQDLSKIGVRLSYSMMEVDENKFLKKISAKIVYPDQTFESIYQYELNATNSIGFYKKFHVKKTIKYSAKEAIESINNITNNDSIKIPKVDTKPIYPKCEKYKKEVDRVNCTSKSVQKFVSKKFNTKLSQKLGLSPGKKRIFIMFTINEQGNAVDIDTRAPHEGLNTEAKRVLSLLPKMIPGKYKGKPVEVKYSMLLNFIIR